METIFCKNKNYVQALFYADKYFLLFDCYTRIQALAFIYSNFPWRYCSQGWFLVVLPLIYWGLFERCENCSDWSRIRSRVNSIQCQTFKPLHYRRLEWIFIFKITNSVSLKQRSSSFSCSYGSGPWGDFKKKYHIAEYDFIDVI